MSISHSFDTQGQAAIAALFGDHDQPSYPSSPDDPQVHLQRAAVTATQQVQQQYDGALDSEQLSKALDFVLARAVHTHLDGSTTVRSGSQVYTVAGGVCTCADYQHRTHLCKHMLAVEIHARTAILLSHPFTSDHTRDAFQAALEPAAHWSRHEPPLLYTGKFHDPELGIEHLICVRCDTFSELWNGVREVTRMVKAKREQHAADSPATPPLSEETPACAYHGPMRPSTKAPGQWFCPSKMRGGSYCKERWPQEVRQ
jgi:SWIM zinc finger